MHCGEEGKKHAQSAWQTSKQRREALKLLLLLLLGWRLTRGRARFARALRCAELDYFLIWSWTLTL
jgi:hypothetical protein